MKGSGLENFRLTVFRAVAAQRNFRRAAEELYLTQPAVTQQIKALEGEIGVALFDRSGREVALTAAGEVLLRNATEANDVLLRSEAEIAALEGRVSGPLRLAVSTTIAQYVLPPMLGRFLRRHPGVQLGMRSANTEQVAAAVMDGSAEVGLVEGPVHRTELRVERWMRDRLVMVAPRGHPWTEVASIGIDRLGEWPMLARERGSGTREIVDAALKAAGAGDIVPAMELNSTEALLACVEAGLGVGFFSRAAIGRQVRMGTLVVVKVEGLTVARDLSFVTPRSGETRGSAAVLLDFLRERALVRRGKHEA